MAQFVLPEIDFVPKQQKQTVEEPLTERRINPRFKKANQSIQQGINKELLLNQEITSLFGGNFDSTKELDNNLLEFDMAKSKNLPAKMQKLKNVYPQGELVPLTLSSGDVKLFYRESPQDKFKFVNKGVNFPELAGALVSGEVLGGILGSRGGPVGTGVGTAVGSLAETGLEKLRGYQTASLESELKEAATEGGLAFAVDSATRGAIKLFNKFKNKGNLQILEVEDFADDISKFADKEALEPVLKGNVLKTPVWKSAFSQSKITSNKAIQKQAEQEKSLIKKFGELGSEFDPSAFSDEELSVILKSQADDLVSTLFKSTNLEKPLSRDFLEQNKNFIKGIEKWKAATGKQKDFLYDQAFTLADDVVFDITPLQNETKNILKGVKAKAKKESGQLFQFDEAVQLRDIPDPVKKIISKINKLDPKVSTYQGSNPIAQLKEIRTELYGLQQSEDKITKAYATQMFSKLKEVMGNPFSGNKSFLESYKKASQYNAWREKILDLTVIKKSLKSDSVEDIIQSKFNITQPSEVAYIKEVFKNQPETIKMLKNSYLTDIISDNATLNKFLNKEGMYADVVSEIFEKQEVNAIKQFAKAKEKLNKSQLKKVIEQDVSNVDRAFTIIEKEGYDSFSSLIKKQGGKNSKFANSLKAGIYKKILDDATVTNEKGINQLDLSKLKSSINSIKNNKSLSELLLSSDDISRLDNFNLYASIIDTRSDVGGAMQQGEIAAKAKAILDISSKIKVGKAYLDNAIIAKLLTQPYKPGEILSGKLKDLSPKKINYFTVGLLNLSNNLEKERKTRDPRLERLKSNKKLMQQ